LRAGMSAEVRIETPPESAPIKAPTPAANAGADTRQVVANPL